MKKIMEENKENNNVEEMYSADKIEESRPYFGGLCPIEELVVPMVVPKTDLLKSIQSASKPLEKWDVEFSINQEVLGNILNYGKEINLGFLVKFYVDKILIQLKSPDHIQYTDINIPKEDISEYNPELDKYRDLHKDSHGDMYKVIYVPDFGKAAGIVKNGQIDDIAMVRIDTITRSTIEFNMPGGFRFGLYAHSLTEEDPIKKAVERLPDIIDGVRNNPDIKVAQVIMEPATFNRLCKIFNTKGKSRDIDDRVLIKICPDGLKAYNGDRLLCRMLNLIYMPPNGYGDGNDNSDSWPDVSKMTQEEIDSYIRSTGIDITNNINKKNNKKEKVIKPPSDALLGLTVDDNKEHFIYLASEFITPFILLEGLAPIVLEIRTDKPLFIEQKLANNIIVMLTVAPRIENEDE